MNALVGAVRRAARIVTGALLATVGVTPAAHAADVIQYYHLDAIGNVRVVSDAAGALVERHEYLPFGEEWCQGPPAGVCGTVAGQPKRFTGKERDSETGLDYFGARYYRGSLARFTTIDPAKNMAASLLNPQKWNRYAYARNNPLAYVDPDGLEEVTIVVKGFIPDRSVTFPPGVGPTFKGDDRDFTLGPASSRVSATVTVETDPSVRADPVIPNSASATSSGSASDWLGGHKTALAEPTLSVTGGRDANGNVTLHVGVSAKDPLTPQWATPAAAADLNFSIPRNARSAGVRGSVTTYPAWEVEANRRGSDPTALVRYKPTGASNTPAALPFSRNVQGEKELP